MSNPIVVPASRTKGLEMVEITMISLEWTDLLQDDSPANVLAFASLSSPIFRAVLRILSRSARANEARPPRL